MLRRLVATSEMTSAIPPRLAWTHCQADVAPVGRLMPSFFLNAPVPSLFPNSGSFTWLSVTVRATRLEALLFSPLRTTRGRRAAHPCPLHRHQARVVVRGKRVVAPADECALCVTPWPPPPTLHVSPAKSQSEVRKPAHSTAMRRPRVMVTLTGSTVGAAAQLLASRI